MTDSTVENKSQHFWGEAETNAMLDILREMDIMIFWKIRKYKHWNGSINTLIKILSYLE